MFHIIEDHPLHCYWCWSNSCTWNSTSISHALKFSTLMCHLTIWVYDPSYASKLVVRIHERDISTCHGWNLTNNDNFTTYLEAKLMSSRWKKCFKNYLKKEEVCMILTCYPSMHRLCINITCYQSLHKQRKIVIIALY